MLVMDAQKFRERLRRSHFRSVEGLARSLGIHRNTIQYYLAGHRVLPEKLEGMIRALRLSPFEILLEKDEEDLQGREDVGGLVDRLHEEFPKATFVLFGSRARGMAKKYADWDVGVYSLEGIPHSTYRLMSRRKEDLSEDLPFLVDLVNLNRLVESDPSFLRNISREWVLLAGRQQDWLALSRLAKEVSS